MLRIINIPIVGKFIIVIAVFGIMSIASVVYATHGMRQIDDGYSKIIVHEGIAAVEIARAARGLNQAALAIADLVLATTDEGNRVANADLA